MSITPDAMPATTVPAKASPLRLLRSALVGAVFGVAGGLAGTALVRAARRDHSAWLEQLSLGGWDLAGLALSAMAAVVLHELGHLLGGLRSGMRVLMLAAGPLRLSQGRGGWRVSRHSMRHGLLGFVSMLPDPARPFVPQFRSLAAGGPLASLGCVALGILAALPLDGRWALHATAFAAFSALVLLMTAIPMRMGGIETDGAQLRDLARGGVGTQLKSIVLGLAGQSVAGARPRELDAALLAQGLVLAEGCGAADPALAAYAHLLAALRADDLGHGDEHARQMERVAALAHEMQPAARAQFAVELACHATRRGDAKMARDWLAHAAGGVIELGDRKRAEASIALLEHRHDDARKAVAQARSLLASTIDAGGALWAADQLDRLEAQLPRA